MNFPRKLFNGEYSLTFTFFINLLIIFIAFQTIHISLNFCLVFSFFIKIYSLISVFNSADNHQGSSLWSWSAKFIYTMIFILHILIMYLLTID